MNRRFCELDGIKKKYMVNSANLRIAHVMAGAVQGGAELFYERLCIAQHQQGLTVLPIIRKNPGRSQILSKTGLNPIELAFGGKLDWWTKIRLERGLKEFSPDIAIAWMNRAASFMPRGNWVSVGRLGGFYNLKHYRKCDHLVGNTRGIVEWIKNQGWPVNRVHYVPNFVHEFSGTSPSRPECIPLHAPFLLALGRLHHSKGFDVLIRAMSHLKEPHLFIAGEGEERENLQKLAESLHVSHRVHMPGWVKDISGLIQACDVLVCSSRHEPLGNIVLEGFSAVKPVVAIASQGPLELIDQGVNGVLSPLENEQMLAKSIGNVLNQPDFAHRIALAGRQKFEQEFSQKEVLRQWLQFFLKVRKA